MLKYFPYSNAHETTTRLCYYSTNFTNFVIYRFTGRCYMIAGMTIGGGDDEA